jgi:hypothetical protein
MRTAAARPIEACLLDLLQHFGIWIREMPAGQGRKARTGAQSVLGTSA